MNTSTLSPGAAALRRWAVPIALAITCVLLSVGGDMARGICRYERTAIEGGELWRLLTAHLVHLGPTHTLLNVAALGILVLLLDDVLESADWLFVSIAAALVIDVGLFWFSPEIEWYVGLSGVLHGCIAAGGVRLALARTPIGVLLLLMTAAKLVWEQTAGALPFSDVYAGGPVVVDAHLYGAAGGAAASIALVLVRRSGARSV